MSEVSKVIEFCKFMGKLKVCAFNLFFSQYFPFPITTVV